MKTATIQEIKHELTSLSDAALISLCLRLARFKKDNKELLHYLLFETHDVNGYIASAKDLIEEQFETINLKQVYFAKKTLRKVLRTIAKFSKYSGLAVVEIELLIVFCTKMKTLPLHKPAYPVLQNIYLAQLKKIDKAIATLHEDLQYDYNKQRQFLDI
jgi:hypothetical protein